MNKAEAIAAVIDLTTAEPVVFTTGYSCRIARGYADRANHFYMTGSMGLAATIGTGIALSVDVAVVVVDGDGSLAMNPAAVLTAGAFPGLRMVHVVLDDEVYESTGSQPVPSGHYDYCDLARLAGYRQVGHHARIDQFQNAFRAALARDEGPSFLHCRLAPSANPLPPRVDLDLGDLRQRLGRHLQALR